MGADRDPQQNQTLAKSSAHNSINGGFFLGGGFLSFIHETHRIVYGYRHEPSQPIQEYISGITGLATRLKAIGVKLDDIDINDVLLFNLDKSWPNIAASLSASTDELNIVTDVTGPLLDEEGRRRAKEDNSATVMLAKGKRSDSFKCFRCGKTGHIARNCRENIPEPKKNPEKETEDVTDVSNLAFSF
jgi:hypothetical protein